MRRNESVFFIFKVQQNLIYVALKDEMIKVNLQLLVNFNADNILESDYNLNGSSISIYEPELSLLSDSALKSVSNDVKKIAKLLSQLLLNDVCRCNEVEHQRVYNQYMTLKAQYNYYLLFIIY